MSFNFNKILPILLLTGLSTVGCWDDYDMQHTVHCRQINNDWSFTQNLQHLWGVAILHSIDRYFILIFSPLILIVQIVIVFALIKYKLYRSSPLDIICACFISQCFLNICLWATAIFKSIYNQDQPMPSAFPMFCLITAIINSVFGILQRMYLLLFLVFIVLSMKKSIKKSKWFLNSRHLIPLITTAVSVVLIIVLNWYGLNQLGFCSITSTRNNQTQIYFPIIQLLFSTSFVVFAVITYKYFKKHMPKGVALDRRVYEQNQLMTRFVFGMSIILMFLSITMLILYLGCLDPNPGVLFITTLSNIVKLISFVYLIIVIVYYKRVGNKLKRLFRSIFSNKPISSSTQIGERRPSRKEILQLIDVGMKQKILDIQQDEDQIDFLKIVQIMTILTGIKISYKEYLCQKNPFQLKHLCFHEETSFQISPHLIKQYEQQAYILPRISLLKGKFTIFAPRVFTRLLQQDNVEQLWRSFELLENSDQLYRVVQSEGGKSGQFFFFTSDNKYILKTINKEEFHFFLQYLQQFYKHYTTHSNTLIAKIYGIFKIENTDFRQHYYILLMKNISGCSGAQIIRTYDMKGSTDNRQILKEKDYQDVTRITKSVLKDLDFIRLQNQIEIGATQAKQLRNQLIIDTQFLRDMNIIDYSLLLMRVRWNNPPKQPHLWKKLNRIQSSIDPNQYYHISLIDYFQKWDLQKKSEQWWKNLFGKKDVSAQQPSVYQLRFIKFIRQITSCDSHRVAKQEDSMQPSQSRQTELVKYSFLQPRLKKRSLVLPKVVIKQIRATTMINN